MQKWSKNSLEMTYGIWCLEVQERAGESYPHSKALRGDLDNEAWRGNRSITLTFFEVQVDMREMPLGSSEPSLHTGTCASLVLLNPSKRSVILSLHNIPVLGPTQRKCEVWFKLLLCCTNFPIYPAICFYLAVGDAAKFLYFMEKGTLYDCTYRLQRKV